MAHEHRDGTQDTAVVCNHQLRITGSLVFCSSCWRTIGCIGYTADGFICRVSSLMPCTMLGWHCTRLVFSCSTWSRMLRCTLSDEMWSYHRAASGRMPEMISLSHLCIVLEIVLTST